MRIRNRHNELELEFFLHFEQLEISKCWRWLEYTGWSIEQSGTTIKMATPMGGYTMLNNPMQFSNKKECMFTKSKLNSEYVKQHEPDNFNVIWKDTYNKTHQDEKNFNDFKDFNEFNDFNNNDLND
jgi:hypothetical protein